MQENVVLKALKGIKENGDLKDSKACRVLKEIEGRSVSKEIKVPLVHKAFRESKESREKKALKATWVPKVNKESVAHKDLQENEAQSDRKEIKVPLVHKDFKDFKDLKVQLDQQALRANEV